MFEFIGWLNMHLIPLIIRYLTDEMECNGVMLLARCSHLLEES